MNEDKTDQVEPMESSDATCVIRMPPKAEDNGSIHIVPSSSECSVQIYNRAQYLKSKASSTFYFQLKSNSSRKAIKRPGKVTKRKLSRQRPTRKFNRYKRKPRRKPRRKPTQSDLESTFSGSSCSCKRCRKRQDDKQNQTRAKRQDRKYKPKVPVLRDSGCQHGTPCPALSPLFISEHFARNSSEQQLEATHYSQVTPQMIHEALVEKTKWSAYVSTGAIFEHITTNYTVNPNSTQLLEELKEKLNVALSVGIVVSRGPDHWGLGDDRMTSLLPESHVSLFWTAYLAQRLETKNREAGPVSPFYYAGNPNFPAPPPETLKYCDSSDIV